jgi:regulator of protease activity HflC (stomatin/prohibitin superfamily)
MIGREGKGDCAHPTIQQRINDFENRPFENISQTRIPPLWSENQSDDDAATQKKARMEVFIKKLNETLNRRVNHVLPAVKRMLDDVFPTGHPELRQFTEFVTRLLGRPNGKFPECDVNTMLKLQVDVQELSTVIGDLIKAMETFQSESSRIDECFRTLYQLKRELQNELTDVRNALNSIISTQKELGYKQNRVLFNQESMLQQQTHMLFNQESMSQQQTHMLFNQESMLQQQTHMLFNQASMSQQQTHMLFNQASMSQQQTHLINNGNMLTAYAIQTMRAVEGVLQNQQFNMVDDAARQAEARRAEDARQAEARRAEDARQAEARRAEDARQAEARRAEDARQAEAARQAAADEARLKVEQERLKLEQDKLAERKANNEYLKQCDKEFAKTTAQTLKEYRKCGSVVSRSHNSGPGHLSFAAVAISTGICVTAVSKILE